jgi:hypothetical protein
LKFLAEESTKFKEQRTKAAHRVAVLEAAIKTCRQYKGVNHSTLKKGMPAWHRPFPASVVHSDSSGGKDSDVLSKASKSSEGRPIEKAEAIAMKGPFGISMPSQSRN